MSVHIILRYLYVLQHIIDGYFKILQSNNNIIAADSRLSQVVRFGLSTRRTWADTNFSRVSLHSFPLIHLVVTGDFW
jgi:hypothetical protein